MSRTRIPESFLQWFNSRRMDLVQEGGRVKAVPRREGQALTQAALDKLQELHEYLSGDSPKPGRQRLRELEGIPEGFGWGYCLVRLTKPFPTTIILLEEEGDALRDEAVRKHPDLAPFTVPEIERIRAMPFGVFRVAHDMRAAFPCCEFASIVLEVEAPTTETGKDPRPDLESDSVDWDHVLTLALKAPDQDQPRSTFTVLQAVRAAGARLQRMEGGGYALDCAALQAGHPDCRGTGWTPEEIAGEWVNPVAGWLSLLPGHPG